MDIREEFRRIIDDVSGGTHNSQEWFSDVDAGGEPCTPIIEELLDLLIAAHERALQEHDEINCDMFGG